MKIKRIPQLLVFTTLLIGLGCTTEEIIFDSDVQFRSDQGMVDQFLAEHDIDATPHRLGFSYIIDDLGTGEFPHDDCILDLEMTVYHLDSTFSFSTIPEVEQAHGIEVLFHDVYSVYLNNLPIFKRPPALHALAELIKKNGSIRLFVPSKLGWGTEGLDWGVGDISVRRNIEIPPNTNVLITATLVDIR